MIMSYNNTTQSNKSTCPKCGSLNLKFQMRSAGTKSTSNYYHTYSGNSWIIPSWRKKYRSNRNYKSIALCQDCGYCFEPYQNGSESTLDKLIDFVIIFIYLIVLFFTSNWFKKHKKQFFIVIAILFGIGVLMGVIGFIIPDSALE